MRRRKLFGGRITRSRFCLGAKEGDIASGWSISSHHHLDLTYPSTLFRGDGSEIRSNAIIITIAGGNPQGYYTGIGDGLPAIDAYLAGPKGMCIDQKGNLFIADIDRIRRVDYESGIISTAVGPIGSGYGNLYMTGVAIDHQGTLFISAGNYIIKAPKVEGSAGNYYNWGFLCYGPYNGDWLPARLITLNGIQDIITDDYGNLFVSARYDEKIYKIDANGILTTMAGNGYKNNIYGAPSGYGGYSGDGGPATEAELTNPSIIIWTSSSDINAIWVQEKFLDQPGQFLQSTKTTQNCRFELVGPKDRIPSHPLYLNIVPDLLCRI